MGSIEEKRLDITMAQFTKQFRDRVNIYPIETNVAFTLMNGASPYSVIENLVNIINEQQEKLTAIALTNSSTVPPVYVPYDSLPEELKDKFKNIEK